MEQQHIMFGGRSCGVLKADGTFVVFRTKTHYFIKYHGLAISASVLKNIKDKGCKVVKIIYEYADSSQMVMETYPDKFFELGEVYCDKQGDYQRVLRLDQINMSRVHLKATEQRLLVDNETQRN
jgi:hypothetical protein